MQTNEAERLFSGLIGEEYEMLRLVCPAAATMSKKVGEFAAQWHPGRALEVFEIGCGSGITTLALLHGRGDIAITAVDNEPTMLEHARRNLAQWLDAGRVKLIETDALSGLLALPEASIDMVASGYAVHNFLASYRQRVIREIHRVLKPGGVFVNGDRYALDDSIEHTRLTQEEVRHYFKTFLSLNRQDLLEQWIVHLFSDESPDHIMRLGDSLACLRTSGFEPVEVVYREGVNTLLTAVKGSA